jgi:hypothetical protein
LFISNQIPIEDAMNIFIQNISSNNYELKNMIKNRNELFFLEHSLFDVFGKDKVTHFKRLWRSESLTDEEKDKIWEWVNAFVLLSDAYIKLSKQNL